jgi:alpha-mannosidase
MVTTFQSRRAARLQRRLGELRAWRSLQEVDIPEWMASFPDGQTYRLNLGDFWPQNDLPVNFQAEAEVPLEWSGLPVTLELWLGGEGFVQLSTGFQGGLNPVHHRFPVTPSAAGGEAIDIRAEVVPKGIFGAHLPEPRIERAALVVPHEEVRALERDLTMLAEACEVLDDHEVVPMLYEAAEAALSLLAPAWPTSTEESVTRYVLGYHDGLGSGVTAVPENWRSFAVDNQRSTGPTWSLPDPPRAFESLSDAAIAAANDWQNASSKSNRTTRPLGDSA